MPLARALSKLGAASRAEATRLIAAGRVTVSGRVVIDPQKLRRRGCRASISSPYAANSEMKRRITSSAAWSSIRNAFQHGASRFENDRRVKRI